MADRWTKRTGGVPRGLLRYLVLNMLIKKPMSGSEIVEAIGKETAGRWKPAPGSIYPLLARLQEKGYTIETSSGETGTKQYALTPEGKIFFEKQIDLGQSLLNKLEFLIPILIEGFRFDPNDERILSGTKEPATRVVTTLLSLRAMKNYQLTEQDSKEIGEVLNKCADDLEEIVHRINEKVSPDTKHQTGEKKDRPRFRQH